MNYKCFKEGCELEAQYFHKYLLSEVHSCEFHLKIFNRVLDFDSIFVEPCQRTKDVVLGFLEKKKFKREEIKKSILAASNQNLGSSTEITEETLRNIDSDLEEICGWIEKISQTRKIAKIEQDSILNLLVLQPDIALKRLKEIIPSSSELNNSIRRIYWLSKLKTKTFDIWNKFNISEFEQDFSETCALYKNQKFPSDILLENAYQDYLKAYYNTKFFFQLCYGTKADIKIYETEEEREYLQILDYHWKIDIHKWHFVKLPNDEIFIICETEDRHQEAYTFGRNYELKLPSPDYFKCAYPLIYFNKSVYCMIKISSKFCILRFDLDQKRWIYLTLVQSKYIGNSVIFNGNILICAKKHLLLYSIDIDSFSIISYKHEDDWNMWMDEEENNCITEHKKYLWKKSWLIKAEKRLYLIENFQNFVLIYESEVETEYNWKIIAKSSIFDGDNPKYCLYNKRKIYFLHKQTNDEYRRCWKFDINQKSFIENTYYSDFISLKQTGKNLEKTECHCQTFKFDSDSAAAYISKGKSLKDLGRKLTMIENITQEINQQADPEAYNIKGSFLMGLGMYLEANECFNEAIKLEPHNFDLSYFHRVGDCYRKLGRSAEAIEWYEKCLNLEINKNIALIFKGNTFLYDLGRSLEAIKCYDKIIENEINSKTKYRKGKSFIYEAYYYKGNALLYDGSKIDAIKCYDEVICYIDKDNNWTKIQIERIIWKAYNNKGYALNTLERYLEAVECYNEALKKNPNESTLYINKGNALNALGMNHGAIECFNAAINLKPSEFLLFYDEGRAFNDGGHEEDALKDFDTAYNVMQKNLTESNTRYSIKKILLEWNSNPFDDKLRKRCIELLKKLVKLQEYDIKSRDEFISLKNAILDNPSLINEIEMKSKNIKEEISLFITRAIEVLCLNYHEAHEEAQQNLYNLKKEASKYEKLLITNISDLKSLLKDRLNTQTIENFNH